jgi:hypothetical protein
MENDKPEGQPRFPETPGVATAETFVVVKSAPGYQPVSTFYLSSSFSHPLREL